MLINRRQRKKFINVALKSVCNEKDIDMSYIALYIDEENSIAK